MNKVSDAELTARMVAIGMVFAAKPAEHSVIERTLELASKKAMQEDDFRVLDVLVNWLGVHSRYVNADRLFRLIKGNQSERILAFWTAIAQWKATDSRFTRFRKLYSGIRVDLLSPQATQFQVSRHGEDERFEKTCLRIPANLLRKSDVDVMSPERLANIHRGYRNRVWMGANWRADAWTELEEQPHLSASQLAKELGCAYATAYDAKRDFELLRGGKRSA